MSMFTEPWCGKKKSDAYILHYAGQAFNPQIDRTEQIKQDWLILKKWKLKHQLPFILYNNKLS